MIKDHKNLCYVGVRVQIRCVSFFNIYCVNLIVMLFRALTKNMKG